MADPTSFSMPTDVEHPLGIPTGMSMPPISSQPTRTVINLRPFIAMLLVVTGCLIMGMMAFATDIRLGTAFLGLVTLVIGLFLASEEA